MPLWYNISGCGDRPWGKTKAGGDCSPPAEARFSTPENLAAALNRGAFGFGAVVVGSVEPPVAVNQSGNDVFVVFCVGRKIVDFGHGV